MNGFELYPSGIRVGETTTSEGQPHMYIDLDSLPAFPGFVCLSSYNRPARNPLSQGFYTD